MKNAEKVRKYLHSRMILVYNIIGYLCRKIFLWRGSDEREQKRL